MRKWLHRSIEVMLWLHLDLTAALQYNLARIFRTCRDYTVDGDGELLVRYPVVAHLFSFPAMSLLGYRPPGRNVLGKMSPGRCPRTNVVLVEQGS